MRRTTRVLTGAVVVVLCGEGAGPLAAFAQTRPALTPTLHASRAESGVSGVVIDEHGTPLGGAMVSALGAMTAMAVTDAAGRFSLPALPPGEYSVRAHLTGFAASRRENVRVGTSAPESFRLQLRRLEAPVATSGRNAPLSARPIVASGFGLPAVETDTEAAEADEDHSHSETAWRLRHLTRSILKDSANRVVVESSEDEPSAGSRFAGNSASPSALFSDLPFSG